MRVRPDIETGEMASGSSIELSEYQVAVGTKRWRDRYAAIV
jgi:hypothetical protein